MKRGFIVTEDHSRHFRLCDKPRVPLTEFLVIGGKMKRLERWREDKRGWQRMRRIDRRWGLTEDARPLCLSECRRGECGVVSVTGQWSRKGENSWCDKCDVRNVHQGYQGGHQSGSNWPKIGHIRDFFRSDFSTFWPDQPKCTEIWSEKAPGLSHLGPIWPTFEPNLPPLLADNSELTDLLSVNRPVQWFEICFWIYNSKIQLNWWHLPLKQSVTLDLIINWRNRTNMWFDYHTC